MVAKLLMLLYNDIYMKRIAKEIFYSFFFVVVLFFSCCSQTEDAPIFYAIEREQPN